MKSNRAIATHAVFPTTCWTDVLSLRNASSDDVRDRAMSELCTTYWYPLYAFARHRGKSPHDAEDAVQSFFLTIGSSAYFQKADANKGKMRTFLLTGFTRHLKDLHVHASAMKRGGGKPAMSLDAEQAEEWLNIDPATTSHSPDLQFERAWAHSTIHLAIDSLRHEASSSEKAQSRFDVLSRFLKPETSVNTTHQQAADELGISVEACDKAIQRLRKNFREAVKEQVAATLENPTEENVMEEMSQLQTALARQ
ncbi:MAG: RNA polymerase sigma factor [Akkermansiaceae bacterium]